MTGTKPEVLALLAKMMRDAAHALANVALSAGQAEKPRSKSPVGGAAAGLSRIAVAMRTVRIAATTEPKPTQLIHASFSILRILAKVATMRYEQKPKMTLQVPCLVTALRAIESPKVVRPAARIQVMMYTTSVASLTTAAQV